MCLVVFFLFKQKTAYELRISDWSSDVCSSDLGVERLAGERTEGETRPHDDRDRESNQESQHRRLDRGQDMPPPDAVDKAGRQRGDDIERARDDQRGYDFGVVGELDRKGVVEGKDGSVRVELGGGRDIEKKKNKT